MPTRDLESWMWAEACAMIDRADRLHRQFLKPSVMKSKPRTWEPPVDIYETQYEFKIMIALPGVNPEQVKIQLEKDHLIVTGKRHLPVSAETEIRRLEIPCGRFERIIDLPAGHFEIGNRKFLNGCLLISLQKI